MQRFAVLRPLLQLFFLGGGGYAKCCCHVPIFKDFKRAAALQMYSILYLACVGLGCLPPMMLCWVFYMFVEQGELRGRNQHLDGVVT